MKNALRYFAIVSLASSTPAVAQVAPPPLDVHQEHLPTKTTDAPPMTLDAAIAEALENNPTLIAVRRELDVVRQRPAQDRTLAPPTLEAMIWQWPLDTLNPLNTNMYMFTMRQDIPGSGKRALREAVTQKDVERATNDIAVRARDVIAQVKRAYSALFVARQAVAVHEGGVDLSRQIADLTTAKYVAGHGAQREALTAVVEISKLHSDLIDLDAQAQLAAAQLNMLLNRDPAAPIGDVGAFRFDASLPPLEELQRQALEHNGDMRGVRLDVQRAEAALAVAAHESKPDFMVGGGYQLMPRSVGAWTASIGVTWPGAPWSRGGLDAKKAEASAEVVAADAREQAVRNAVRLAVQQAYVRSQSAAAHATLLDTTIIPQAQQLLEASRVDYQSGRGDIASLVEQQHGLLETRLDYFRALAAMGEARADLDYTVGDDPAFDPSIVLEGK
jgi:cobalt-zinc-cadmium efflux system outer membrane protein